jgi:uncharacterized membrane protein YfcA
VIVLEASTVHKVRRPVPISLEIQTSSLWGSCRDYSGNKPMLILGCVPVYFGSFVGQSVKEPRTFFLLFFFLLSSGLLSAWQLCSEKKEKKKKRRITWERKNRQSSFQELLLCVTAFELKRYKISTQV